MTVSRRLVVLYIFSAGVCLAHDSDAALVAALRWYHRWIAVLPSTTESINCTVAAFPASSFAYCEPGSLAIDIDTPPGSPAVATNVTPLLLGFSAALTDFVNHRYSGPRGAPTIKTLSIPAGSVAQCTIDLDQTRRVSASAVGSGQRKQLLKRGIVLRFPFLCNGDPFYLLYFMKGNDVEWIWQMRSGAGPIWHYSKSGEQRKIPDVAIENLTKPELWYEGR
jgi:hypothetical protein